VFWVKKKVKKTGFWVKTKSNPDFFETMNKFITDALSAPVATKKRAQSCWPIREGLHVDPDKMGEAQQRLFFAFFFFFSKIFFLFFFN
jgi:hypothetical protein